MLLVTSIVMHCENDGEHYNCSFEAFFLQPVGSIFFLESFITNMLSMFPKFSASDGRINFFSSLSTQWVLKVLICASM